MRRPGENLKDWFECRVWGGVCVVCWHEGNTEEENNGYVVFEGKYGGGWREGGVTPPLTLPLFTMLLHNGGFCNPTALQNGACTYQSISKQMYYKTTFSHNGHKKSLTFLWKLHHSVLSEKKTFWQYYNMHGILPKVVELTIKKKQQLRNNTILSRALSRNCTVMWCSAL